MQRERGRPDGRADGRAHWGVGDPAEQIDSDAHSDSIAANDEYYDLRHTDDGRHGTVDDATALCRLRRGSLLSRHNGDTLPVWKESVTTDSDNGNWYKYVDLCIT